MEQTKKLGFIEQILGLDTRFWIVNTMELFERLAYYGVRSVIAIYMVLPLELGGPQLTHVEKGTIFLWWAGFQSILPMFTGGYADRYGHKNTIAFAIVIKIIGYVMMAHFMSFWGFFTGCMFLASGTAIFKPGVQGTLATTLKQNNASVGWGIFYQLVNIGGFLGPVLAGILRILAWKYVFYACAIIVAINFLWLPFYKDPSKDFAISEEMKNPLKVFVTSVLGIFRPRVFFFCLAFSGFWLMFNQVFDLLPNVIDDWVDSSSIIRDLGNSLNNPLLTGFFALLISIIFGGISAITIFLSLRPDQRKASQVPWNAYIIVAISFTFALYFPAQLFLKNGTALFATIALSGIVISILSRKFQIHAKYLASASGFLALIPTLFLSYSYLHGKGQVLIEMASKGTQVNPEWLVNLNPGLIVFTMAFFGYLTSFVRPMVSILIGIAIATIGSILAGTATVGWFCLLGIAVFSIGEMLSSPKKLEYLASLAPPGQKGLFMGYANFPVAIGWMIGSKLAGNRYELFGDKVNLAKQHMEQVLGMGKEFINQLPKSEVVPTLANKLNLSLLETQKFLFNTYHPERLWYEIGLIGISSVVLMIIYDRVVRYVDRA